MLIKILLAVFFPVMAFAADDDWAKVRAIKSGTELKIYKSGARQPLLARMDEASDEKLIVVVKSEQTAIPKDQIDRIDYRPPQTGPRLKTETKTETEQPGGKNAAPLPQRSVGPSTSVSNNVSFSKADFEVIYRRRSGAPKQ